jgi:hypothetical protein
MSRDDDEFDWHAWKQKAPRKKKRVPVELPSKPKNGAHGFFSRDEKATNVTSANDPREVALRTMRPKRRRKRKRGRALPK